jgi:hypothetical protein
MQVDPVPESPVQERPICPSLLIPRKSEPPWTVERMFLNVIAQCTQALKTSRPCFAQTVLAARRIQRHHLSVDRAFSVPNATDNGL